MIKNIIFDFGDIFINLDKPATDKYLNAFGVNHEDPELISVMYSYEKGLMTTVQFMEYFYITYAIGKEDLLTAWNSILLDFPAHRLRFIQELSASKKYRLFLLSNTNDMHISWIQKDWGIEVFEQFKNCFEKFYLSHQIHFRKPDEDIFNYVLSENDLVPEETLFVDDVSANTATAKKLGMHVWNLVPGKEDVVNLKI
ncbi:haloacid dehalogenase [Polaribacter pacificus]|uniref:Haloacid dehalogenase n=1 Tax=Polaribacter pacificus TaxID=1775173 RepID=A0A917MEW6_9FLAO|nr:HAD-IA family hydrolase [Polaribacter pacificus]GGH00423.1 haloacid dehalogenase [Polaribacter pacificus]